MTGQRSKEHYSERIGIGGLEGLIGVPPVASVKHLIPERRDEPERVSEPLQEAVQS